MIYYDQSEGRENTRLPASIVKEGMPVVGLEPLTGADLMITQMEGLAGNLNRPPGSAQLPMYLENSFLVQRKSGTDLLNSIPELHRILWRMRMAGDKSNCRYWLLVCGLLDCSRDNYVIIDNWTSGWHWSSLQGALEMWQLFGGHVSINATDQACELTLERWNRNIGKWAADVEKLGLPKPEIPKVFIDPRPWRSTLMTFPNCGDIMSDRIAEKAGRLCDSLIWMSEENSYGVPGVGPKTLSGFRNHLGLKDGEHLAIFTEMPTIHTEATNEG